MKIYVKAKPRSKKEYVKKIDDTNYIVSVKEPPVFGQANKAIIKSLAEYVNKLPSQINITSGEKSKQKTVEVPVTNEELKTLKIQNTLF